MPSLALLTAEDFERVAHTIGPCELLDGEIVRMSPAGFEHNAVASRIFFLLESHNRRHGLGRVLTNETGLVVRRGPDTVRGADVLFISRGRLGDSGRWSGYLTVAPELVVEVLSEEDSWKHVETKVAEYHAFGVDLVWVADPKTAAVRVYARGAEPVVLQRGAVLAGGEVVPGFSCQVDEIFET